MNAGEAIHEAGEMARRLQRQVNRLKIDDEAITRLQEDRSNGRLDDKTNIEIIDELEHICRIAKGEERLAKVL